MWDFVSAVGIFSFLLIKCRTGHPRASEGKINGVVARGSNSLFVILVFYQAARLAVMHIAYPRKNVKVHLLDLVVVPLVDDLFKVTMYIVIFGGEIVQIYTVSFFGHRRIADWQTAETRLFRQISELIKTKEYVEFLIGRNGDFDRLAASAFAAAGA